MRDRTAVVRKLNHVVVERARFAGESFDWIRAALDGLLAELLQVLGEGLPVVPVLFDELFELLAQLR